MNGSGIGIAAGLAIAAIVLAAVWCGASSPIGGANQWSYALYSGSASASKAGE